MPTRYWHPFADMHKVRDHELVLVRGAGAWIEDVVTETEISLMADGFEAALAEVAAA
jgi:adenosylmethionine-8-amino-7-oxononanoate aminotransferase